MNIRSIFRFIVCIMLAVFLEYIITFDGKSGWENYEVKTMDLQEFYSASYENIEYSEDGITIHNYDEVSIINDCDIPLKSMSISISSKDVIKGKVLLKDEGMKHYWQYATSFCLYGGGKSDNDIFS